MSSPCSGCAGPGRCGRRRARRWRAADVAALQPASAGRRGRADRCFQSADRRGLGCRRKYFRLRWLWQLESREIRQERRVHQILGFQGNGAGQFNTPHTIATDAQGNVYVGDRGNRRIQVFDNDGEFKNAVSQCRAPHGRSAFRQGRISISSVQIPTAQPIWRTAKFTRWNWTDKF